VFTPSIAIIGAGKAGAALGAVLASKGCRICGVASRSLASAQKLACLYQAAASINAQDVTREADIIFITTPDDCILPATLKVAAADGFRPGQYVFHTSGALGPNALASAKECGAFIGCMHPLQTLAGTPTDKEYLAQGYFAVDGDKEAVEMAERLVALIGGTSFYIPAASRAQYHAAAAVASNYLVALLHAAEELLSDAGLPPETSINALMPLVYGTLKNIEQQGTIRALTGPISRGDISTVQRHLAALVGTKEADVYAALARYTTGLALKKGTISDKQAEDILKLVK
jgi:predicted short-subunit dehydrogenase-like oxidoreductase (DUF2520 family)